MRIVIISACAPPEPICAGRVNYDIAEYLTDLNNEVWILSPEPSRPLDVKYPRISKNIKHEVKKNLFRVNIKSFVYPKYNLLLRTYESFDFGVKSIRYVNRIIKDYDILYGLPWPFIGQLMVLLLRKNKNASLIWNIQDLYPESFFLKIKSRFIRKVFQPLYIVDKFLAKKSTHLTLVSDTIRRVYLENRNIPEDKLTVIRNWQDESEFIKKIPSKEALFEKYKLEILKDKFIFMYLGNIGPVAGVETIIEAFSKLNMNKTALIIAGSGTSRNRCQILARELNSSNILFVDVPLGLRPVVELQSLSNVLLLPILPEAANSSIPSKLIAYMFSKKPIISSADEFSETAIAINESQSGWLTKSNKISDWIEVMTQAYKLPIDILDEKGESGYSYAMLNYSKTEGLKKVNQLFIKLKN